MMHRVRLALVPPLVLGVSALLLYGLIHAAEGHLLIIWLR